MTRDSGLDPILGPWMRRSAPTAPDDLLGRVMTEVETMSQRNAAGMTWFTASPAHIGLTATALVAALALAVGILLGNGRIGPAPPESPSPTPAISRTTDRGGDGPEGYDVVAVTTSVTGDRDLVVAVELSTPWPADPHLLGWLHPDEATHPGMGALPGGRLCQPYGTGYAFDVDRTEAGFTTHSHNSAGNSIDTQRTELDFSVDERVLTVVIPLSLLGDPETLGMGLGAGGATGFDFFPDGRGGDCQPVPLPRSSL